MELKDYQQTVLEKFDYYLNRLAAEKEEAEDFVAFQKTKGKPAKLGDFSRTTWEHLVQERRIETLRNSQGEYFIPAHISRFDGLDRTIPNVCFKVPTGGGKTLLGAAAIERLLICTRN